MNKTVKDIHTSYITDLNSLLYTAAYVVTERIRMMEVKKVRKNNEPF